MLLYKKLLLMTFGTTYVFLTPSHFKNHLIQTNSVTLELEAACSSKTVKQIYYPTWWQHPKDNNWDI